MGFLYLSTKVWKISPLVGLSLALGGGTFQECLCTLINKHCFLNCVRQCFLHNTTKLMVMTYLVEHLSVQRFYSVYRDILHVIPVVLPCCGRWIAFTNLQMLHKISSGLLCPSRQKGKKFKSLSGISSTNLGSIC